jgi:hypothetical protein
VGVEPRLFNEGVKVGGVGFVQMFYGQLVAGVPIGQAVREAHLAIKAGGDPTWLAYTVFADPLATVQA